MSANNMILKSCKVFKKAKGVTSSTPVKEEANLVIQSHLNVKHGCLQKIGKQIENTKAMISNSQIFTFMAPFYGWGSTVSRLQNHCKEVVYFLPLSSQKFLVQI